MKFNKDNLLEKIKEKNKNQSDNIFYWVDNIFEETTLNRAALSSKKSMEEFIGRQKHSHKDKTIDVYEKIKETRHLLKEGLNKDLKTIIDCVLDFSTETKNESDVSAKISKLLFFIFSSEKLFTSHFLPTSYNLTTYNFTGFNGYDLVLKSTELPKEKEKENMYLCFFKGLSDYSRKHISWNLNFGDKNFLNKSNLNYENCSFCKMFYLNKRSEKTKLIEVDLFFEMAIEFDEINFFSYKKLFSYIDDLLKKEKQFGSFSFFYFHCLNIAKNNEDKRMIIESLFKSLSEKPFPFEYMGGAERDLFLSGKALLSKAWIENSHLVDDEEKKRKKIINYFLKIEETPYFIVQTGAGEDEEENPVSSLIRQLTNSVFFDDFIDTHASSFKAKAKMDGVKGIHERFVYLFDENSVLNNYFSLCKGGILEYRNKYKTEPYSDYNNKQKAESYMRILYKIEAKTLKSSIDKENKKINKNSEIITEPAKEKENTEGLIFAKDLIKQKKQQRF